LLTVTVAGVWQVQIEECDEDGEELKVWAPRDANAFIWPLEGKSSAKMLLSAMSDAMSDAS
jgi:hypothetical protein